MPVQINITGGDAAEAVKELVTLQSFMSAAPNVPEASAPVSTPPVQSQQPATQQAYGQPQQWQAPQSGATVQQGYGQQSPVQQGYGQQQQAPGGTVPTSTPAYSLDQLGVATQPIMDAGHSDQLIGWLQQHGVGSLLQLDPKFYGDFATFLRSLGARI